MKFSEKIMSIFGRKKITIQEVLEEQGESTFGLLLIMLSLPSALPIPAPGYSTPFGIILVIIGFQICIGKKAPWIPKRLRTKKITLGEKERVVEKIQKFATYFEKLIHRRFKFAQTVVSYRIHGLFVLLCGLSMIVPFPLTNTLPAFGVFLIGISMLEGDGLFGVAGWIVCLLGVSLTVSILTLTAMVGSSAAQAAIRGVF